MRLKSVSGVVYHVSDVDKTAQFYEGLGFITTKKDAGQYSMRLNWFTVDFYKQDRTALNDSNGQFLCVSVDDVDAFYDELIVKGYEAGEKPHDTSAGRREFLLTDPHGYQLIFFQKK